MRMNFKTYAVTVSGNVHKINAESPSAALMTARELFGSADITAISVYRIGGFMPLYIKTADGRILQGGAAV